MTVSSGFAERAILGAAFLGGESVVHEAGSLGLQEEHFTDPSLKKVWGILVESVAAGRSLTIPSLVERYPSEVESAGGMFFLTNLTSSCPSATRIDEYVSDILDSSRAAGLLLAAREVIHRASKGGATASDLHEVMETALGTSSSAFGASDQVETAEEIIRSWASERVDLLTGGGQEMKWGLFALDRLVAAGPGHVVVLGGRPKMGKTHLALSLMANVARDHGPVLFCSAEMGKAALARRILSTTTDVRTKNVETFSNGAAAAFREWASVPMYFDYRARSVRAVCSSIRRAHRKRGIVAASVDYLQLLEMSGARSEEEEIGKASKLFKLLAEELEIPILLLVQVNRRCEERHDKRPIMSDIRGSGRVEQDADAVVFVYREAYYNEHFPRPAQVELIVRANRHGPAGTGMAFWSPGDGWFRDPELWDPGFRRGPD
jgi:replicative DNA helicase